MSKNSKRATIFVGGFLVIVMALSTFAPMFSQNVAPPPQQIEPTERPLPTFPAPLTDFSAISFDQVYLHPTGLFAVAQPDGWVPGSPIIEPNRAAVSMTNQDLLSVVEVSVEQPNAPITTVDDLSTRFNEAYLDGTWTRYSDWSETQRVVEADQLVLDFNLTLNRQTYVARQQVWSDGEWIYSVRVVTPSNAVNLLTHLLANLRDTVEPVRDFAGLPFNWSSYYDPIFNHALRYPRDWAVVDSAPGLPASIIAADGTALRVEAAANSGIADEDAARAWVEARGAESISSVATIDQDDLTGYSVAYTFDTVDGEPRSGLALLLNGPDGALHTVDVQFPAESVDLNEVRASLPDAAAPVEPAEPSALGGIVDEAESAVGAPAGPAALPDSAIYGRLVEVVDSFSILPDFEIAPDPNAPTPTPRPTLAPTVVPDADVTTEAEADVTAEATESGG